MPVVLAVRALGFQTGLIALGLGQHMVSLDQLELRTQRGVIQPEDEVAGLDAVASAEVDGDHPAADFGRDAGPLARRDGSGTRVGDGILHAPLLYR